MKQPAPACRAPTASRCCATPTATASPRPEPCSWQGLNSPFGMALVGEDLYVANTDAVVSFPYHEGDTKITAPGVKVADLPAGPLNHHWTKDLIASPDGSEALRHRRLQQQRRRERHGGREGNRAADPGSRSRQRTMARLRLRPAQSQRPGLGAADRRAVDRRQRARRARQRPRARLHDLGEGRRLLRLALQLLRPARRRARAAAAARPGGEGDRARLRARRAHRLARPDLLHRQRCFRQALPAAPSSASTARGTASRAAATR